MMTKNKCLRLVMVMLIMMIGLAGCQTNKEKEKGREKERISVTRARKVIDIKKMELFDGIAISFDESDGEMDIDSNINNTDVAGEYLSEKYFVNSEVKLDFANRDIYYFNMYIYDLSKKDLNPEVIDLKNEVAKNYPDLFLVQTWEMISVEGQEYIWLNANKGPDKEVVFLFYNLETGKLEIHEEWKNLIRNNDFSYLEKYIMQASSTNFATELFNEFDTYFNSGGWVVENQSSELPKISLLEDYQEFRPYFEKGTYSFIKFFDGLSAEQEMALFKLGEGEIFDNLILKADKSITGQDEKLTSLADFNRFWKFSANNQEKN